jgi:hypothetical protein
MILSLARRTERYNIYLTNQYAMSLLLLGYLLWNKYNRNNKIDWHVKNWKWKEDQLTIEGIQYTNECNANASLEGERQRS